MSLGTSIISAGPVAGMEPPRRLVILLVEDEGFVREVTCKVLQSAGYVVVSSRNAAEARRKFRRSVEPIELLLTDVVLPDRDGLVLANELRAICPGLKTIFMSGYPENVVLQSGFHKQGGLYLHKPFSTLLLMEKINQALAGKENTEESLDLEVGA